MTIYSLERVRVCFLVDWASVLHGLKRMQGSYGGHAETTPPGIEALKNLRAAAADVPQPEGVAISIDTLLFGGFTGSDGGATQELEDLKLALMKTSWTGIMGRQHHFREVSPVLSMRPGHAKDLTRGLYRKDDLIGEASLAYPSATPCGCHWRHLTEEWLANNRGGRRVCPECRRQGRETPTVLTQQRQKLVDMLLSSYAFDAARRYALTDDEGAGQIWIASTDADFVPVLATIRRWGLRTIWIQPLPNRSFGYHRALESLGIEVYALYAEELAGAGDEK